MRVFSGGSISSSLQCSSRRWRTRSGLRSWSHTFSANHSVTFSASGTEHSPKPVNSRISVRFRLAERPCQS